jgi:hypothetical protein
VEEEIRLHKVVSETLALIIAIQCCFYVWFFSLTLTLLDNILLSSNLTYSDTFPVFQNHSSFTLLLSDISQSYCRYRPLPGINRSYPL